MAERPRRPEARRTPQLRRPRRIVDRRRRRLARGAVRGPCRGLARSRTVRDAAARAAPQSRAARTAAFACADARVAHRRRRRRLQANIGALHVQPARKPGRRRRLVGREGRQRELCSSRVDTRRRHRGWWRGQPFFLKANKIQLINTAWYDVYTCVFQGTGTVFTRPTLSGYLTKISETRIVKLR